MKVRLWSDEDGWSTDGARITDPAVLERVRRVVDEEGPIIVEHRFYRGSAAPERRIFGDADDFRAYLDAHASAGDAIWVWSFAAVCGDDAALVHGKCPDDEGRVPARGAY